MFNNYVEMLKKATEAMTSLHHTEAGPAEYFSAVGYEFAVIGLGILWLAIIVAVIAIPIVITKWALNGKFATRKWKKFCDLFKEAQEVYYKKNILMAEYTASLNKRDTALKIYEFYEKHCGNERMRPFLDAYSKLSDKDINKMSFSSLTDLYSKKWRKCGVIPEKGEIIHDELDNLSCINPDESDYYAIMESDYTDLKEKAKNLFTFTNEFEKEKKKNLIITWSYLIVSYIIYAIFLVPLILIFI
jgi:hypothetical protein